jgi:hypothetical protein
MTVPAPRSNTRAIVLAAVAGLAIGVVVLLLSRGGDADRAHGSGAPLLPSALPSGQAAPTTSLPPESAAEQGGRYYAVFIAVARDANDPRLSDAQRRAKELGYEGGIGEIGCTGGAREQLNLPKDGTYTAYSVFFDSQERAKRFAAAYGEPVVGVALITAGCLD